ncbi:MAG TPA: hypothetical protein VFI38_12330 [Candidatus Acidoferrum sp.]|nr:hypothetical protein [Candidatus Acidoferrum sp.]
MPEESSSPKLDFNSPKAAPTILTLGAMLWRGIAWWEDIDFVLSIREEKIAMTLELLLDWGWLILAIVGLVWALSAHKSPKDETKVHWGMVTIVGILSFMFGVLITVHSLGSTPNVLGGWGGDPSARNCSANIDESRLLGLKEKYRVILICGVTDSQQDPLEDERIAVSHPFTITGQITPIVAPYGALEAALKTIPSNHGFGLWHSVAVVPKDVNTSDIKRVSDVAKRRGKVLSDPQAGAFANSMANIPQETNQEKKP